MSTISERYILLVEDNANEVVLAIRAMEKCQIHNRLEVVTDGPEALDFLFSKGLLEYPSVVLLDLKLPYIDGLEVLRQIRANEDTKLLPVIMLTSSIDKKDEENCMCLGANGFQQKPIIYDEFLLFIRQIALDWLSA